MYPEWDLTDLYQNISDTKCQQDIEEAFSRARAFEKKYRGTISQLTKADELLVVIQEYESILQQSAKPAIYAELVFAADSKTPAHGAFLQKMKAESLKVYQELVFFELELIQIPEAILQACITDPILANYRHYLERQLAYKPHRLSEAEEKILNDKSLTGSSALTRLFEEELSAQTFTVELPGGTKELSQTQTLELLYSHKREERQAGAAALTKGLASKSRLITFIFNTLAEDKTINDRYNRFATPEASRHLSNEITQEIVDTMTSVITDNYAIVQEFYHFKKELLGLLELMDYDRYAPIVEPKQKHSFDEAQDMVLQAFSAFSPDYTATAKEFFDKRWIDAAERDGKRSGAFCMYCTPDVHPYVFINYGGNISQISTLAHELGHGVHASLMRSQTYLNFDTPLTMAETSSVFGEMLLFDYLKNTITDPQEKLALYVYKIESIFATVFRQVAMYRFEQDYHTLRREKGELLADEISQLWRKRQEELFGDSVTITQDYNIWWSYISHFFHTPFYVYAYAFGELLTLALYAKYKKENTAFVGQYLDLLKAGGSKSPAELLSPLGIDLTQASFWQGGLDIIQDLVEEARKLK